VTPRLTSIVVRLSTLLLPRGPVRERYRAELAAELVAAPRWRRPRMAAGFLLQAWPLRAAVTGAPGAEAGILAPHRPLLCALHLHHHWVPATTEDGGRYLRCSRCGTDNSGLRSTPGGLIMVVTGPHL